MLGGVYFQSDCIGGYGKRNIELPDFSYSSFDVRLLYFTFLIPLARFYKDGSTHELKGIVVYAPITGKVYIPNEVLSLV